MCIIGQENLLQSTCLTEEGPTCSKYSMFRRAWYQKTEYKPKVSIIRTTSLKRTNKDMNSASKEAFYFFQGGLLGGRPPRIPTFSAHKEGRSTQPVWGILKNVCVCTAGLPIRCTLGLCCRFCCRGPISNPRPVLDSPAQLHWTKYLIFL